MCIFYRLLLKTQGNCWQFPKVLECIYMFTQSLLSEITLVKLNVEVDAKYLLEPVP